MTLLILEKNGDFCYVLHVVTFLRKRIYIVSHVKSSIEVLSLLFKFINFLETVFFHKNFEFSI